MLTLRRAWIAATGPPRLIRSVADPGERARLVADVRSLVAEVGPYPKLQVLYTPVAPVPPVTWFYECAECVFFRHPGSCDVVHGRVVPQGWCLLFVNREDDKPLDWWRRVFG